MTIFLLVISLLLNGIAIFSIIILYTRQNRFLEVEKSQKQMLKELEEAVSAWLIEMKEENENFIERMQKLGANPSVNAKTIDNGQIQTFGIKREIDDRTEQKWAEKTGNAFKKQAALAYNRAQTASIAEKDKPKADMISAGGNLPENKNIHDERPHEEVYRDLFVSQVKLLQKQGLSNGEIAKKLNKGKTEIELLLKFSGNEQTST